MWPREQSPGREGAPAAGAHRPAGCGGESGIAAAAQGDPVRGGDPGGRGHCRCNRRGNERRGQQLERRGTDLLEEFGAGRCRGGGANDAASVAPRVCPSGAAPQGHGPACAERANLPHPLLAPRLRRWEGRVRAGQRRSRPVHRHVLSASHARHQRHHPHGFTIGQAFAVWGVEFTNDQLGPYKASSRKQLQVYVNGKRISDPVDYVMHEHDNIVVGYGKPGSFPTEPPANFPSGL